MGERTFDKMVKNMFDSSIYMSLPRPYYCTQDKDNTKSDEKSTSPCIPKGKKKIYSCPNSDSVVSGMMNAFQNLDTSFYLLLK
jgi:hypothetical protein